MNEMWPRVCRASVSISAIAGLLAGALAATAATQLVTTAGAAATPAPPAGVWTKVTRNVGDIGELSFARNHAAVLHVVWVSGHASGHYRIMDTPISPAGQVGAPVTVAGPLPDPSQPGVVVTNNGLEAIWYDTLQSSVRAATRPLIGGSWSLQTVPLLSAINLGGTVTAATGPGATPWFAFLGCGGFCVDKLGSPQVAIPVSECCIYVPGLAVDGMSGKYWLAYGALRGAGDSGVYIQPLSPTGKPLGVSSRLADTSNGGINAVPSQQVALTGRGGGHSGVFAAWQGTENSNQTWRVYVQRLGSGTVTLLYADPSESPVAIAADPNGRIWVVWEQMNALGGGYLLYRRSGPGGTSFGPATAIRLPNSFEGHYNLYASAQAGRLDVLGLWGPAFEFYEHQIVVRLGLTASIRGDQVDFSVTDQGSGVAGATVSFCGSHMTTGTSGQAVFTIKSSDVKTSLVAAASAPTYAPVTTSVPASC